MPKGTFLMESNTYSCCNTNPSILFMKERSHINVKFVTKNLKKQIAAVLIFRNDLNFGSYIKF